MKKVLLLNAGFSEEPLIKELKELGYYVITSGKRPEYPGHKMADKYIMADYSDKDLILEICKKEGVDGIVSASHDYGLLTASYVGEKMGWKGHDTYENTRIIHEKDLFKKLCLDLDIPSPKTEEYDDIEDAINSLEDKSYPIIVKAVDQASGIGIMRANDKGEALVAINNAFDKSRNKRIVIEPFIEGKQESINAFVVGGKVKSFVTCDSYSPINPYLIQTETLMSENYDNLKEQLCDIIEMLFKELQLVDGLITMQMIIKDGKPYIIEAMRRCLGNQYLTAAEAANGFPFHKALVMAELGLDCSGLTCGEKKGEFVGHHAIMADRNGVYKGMDIPNDIMSHVFKYVELFNSGEEITNYKNERMGYIYYSYNTREELDFAAKHFNENIKVYVEDICNE